MPDEPKIKVEDLPEEPEQGGEIDEQGLDGVAGGVAVGGTVKAPRASDPDSGDE